MLASLGIQELAKKQYADLSTGQKRRLHLDTVLIGEGLICHETPDGDGLSECRELGKQLANA